MSSNLKVVLGTNELGRRGPLAEDGPCHRILDGFSALHYNELDTAFMYKSEECIGRYPNKSKYVIATKVNPWSDDGLKYGHVLEQMRISLERLQTSSVDILYLHAPDHTTPIEETLSAVQKLYEEGTFKQFGLSNYASWQVAEIYYICKQKGWVLPTIYQGMYNPLTRVVEGELLPCLRQFGMKFYAYNPLAGGILTGKFKYSDKDKDGKGRYFTHEWSSMYRDKYWRETIFKGIDGVRAALDESYGEGKVSMVSAVFRWMNHHSAMKKEFGDAIVIGGTNLDHITANVKACEEGPLDQRVVTAFEEAWKLDKGNCSLYYKYTVNRQIKGSML